MQLRELEPGLSVYECPKSGGLWIPLESYLAWKEQDQDAPATPPERPATVVPDDSRQRALICPESGRLLNRYHVGHGLPFQIEQSPATGGVWLDKGEWEALKSKGLHRSLNLIFSAAYQRQVRSTEYAQILTETFRDRIGADDFSKVEQFGAWLVRHPRRRDIWCYLLGHLEQKPESGVAPHSASTGAQPASAS